MAFSTWFELLSQSRVKPSNEVNDYENSEVFEWCSKRTPEFNRGIKMVTQNALNYSQLSMNPKK